MATIVVVDDDLLIRALLRHILEREGHSVLEAEDGSKGVSLCRNNVADLVITDSDGIQQETSVLDIPCLSIRDTIDAPYTIEYGTNELVSAKAKSIYGKGDIILRGIRKHKNFPESIEKLNDGKASMRIAKIIKKETG